VSFGAQLISSTRSSSGAATAGRPAKVASSTMLSASWSVMPRVAFVAVWKVQRGWCMCVGGWVGVGVCGWGVGGGGGAGEDAQHVKV
jgi:hypothetical protein